jgi:processive rubber oxygenase RoxA-like protein
VRLFGFLIFAVVGMAASVGEAADPEPVFVDQGPSWTTATRMDFYSRDQGSRLIPLDWLRAIKLTDGQPFLVDGLARFGYLPNPDSADGLPIGFHATGPAGAQTVGMTCSACHTRQIRVSGRSYRIDGGPALVDFQAFLAELDTAVGQVLVSEAAFAKFAAAVFQNDAPPSLDIIALRRDVDNWYLRYHAIMSKALPASGWGLGRLDAVGMIFNRVSGLDIGQPPTFLIPDNIRVADAPARYPFIWNAPKQDQTQWPGFADNGSDTLGLARNVGEVLGVFATFQPKRQGPTVNFLNGNSANFDGLSHLEGLVKKIAAPRWPWPIDLALAAEGKRIFDRPTANGGCTGCHGIMSGRVRFPFNQTWATPVQNVGTDTRQYDILGWTAKSGALKGVYIPLVTSELKETDLSVNILATSVIGSIAEQVLTFGGGGTAGVQVAAAADPAAPAGSPGPTPLPPALRDLNGAFKVPPAVMGAPDVRMRLGLEPSLTAATPPPKGAYEARVLLGIWAAAPYLHNGSVSTLAELLKPSAQRKPQFDIGADYDIQEIGLASIQAQPGYVRVTTDCADLNSGNSRCGHDFGTNLGDTEKKALLEYLKTL